MSTPQLPMPGLAHLALPKVCGMPLRKWQEPGTLSPHESTKEPSGVCITLRTKWTATLQHERIAFVVSGTQINDSIVINGKRHGPCRQKLRCISPSDWMRLVV